MSATMSATCLIESTISFSEVPARLTSCTPSCTWRRRVGDQVLDVLRRLRGALREAAHLGGDHREAPAGLARARGFDRGIERQQVGLARDLVDHRDDVGDLARRFLDPRHRRHRLRHHLAAAIGDLAGAAGQTRWRAWRSRHSSSPWPRSAPSRPRSLPGSRPAPRCAATGRWSRWRFRRLRSTPPARSF